MCGKDRARLWSNQIGNRLSSFRAVGRLREGEIADLLMLRAARQVAAQSAEVFCSEGGCAQLDPGDEPLGVLKIGSLFCEGERLGFLTQKSPGR